MAKLGDQVTPSEMLNIIRDGALKNEVIKRFRTSEQELAIMLLPLYRNGTLSKEEFNDFFKGVALRRPEEPSEGKKEEDEPPSAIFKALTDVHDRKVVEAAVKAAEEEIEKQQPIKETAQKEEHRKEDLEKKPAAEFVVKKVSVNEEKEIMQTAPAPFAQPQPAPEEPVVSVIEEVVESEESLVEEELLEESEIFEDFEAIGEPEVGLRPTKAATDKKLPEQPIEQDVPVHEIAPPPPMEMAPIMAAPPTPPSPAAVPEPMPAPSPVVSPEPQVAAVAETHPVTPLPSPVITPEPLLKAQGGKTIDSAGMSSFFEMIFAKLGTIENRLSQIEKKLGV